MEEATVPDTTTARPVGHDDLTGWYRLNPKPATAIVQAENLIARWGSPRRWLSIDGILHGAEADRQAA
jgi:hypothetical protein